MKHLIQSAFLLAASTASIASANTGETRTVTEVKNVETLNDDLNTYSGKVVRVTGEIEDRIDSRSVVLESGGIFNDEIVVIAGPKVKGLDMGALKEDEKVVVTGTIVTKPLADVQREYSWTPTQQMLGEFTDTKAFLVAEEISAVKK